MVDLHEIRLCIRKLTWYLVWVWESISAAYAETQPVRLVCAKQTIKEIEIKFNAQSFLYWRLKISVCDLLKGQSKKNEFKY